MLLKLGAAERIDADEVVHELMVPGTPTTRAIGAEFGADVLLPDGSVDRARLGEVVFADHGRLRKLESITHPAVHDEILRRIAQLAGQDVVIVVDAVRLLQSDLLLLCDEVWVVTCNHQQQRERLIRDRGMSPEATAARIAAQPEFDHCKVTKVIDNSGTLQELEFAVRSAWQDFIG
jgi:dephospho-CoA kinase